MATLEGQKYMGGKLRIMAEAEPPLFVPKIDVKVWHMAPHSTSRTAKSKTETFLSYVRCKNLG